MTYAVSGEMISLVESENGTNKLTQENVYNHDGIRIGRIEDGAKREYYYDGGMIAFTREVLLTLSKQTRALLQHMIIPTLVRLLR